MTKTDGSDGPHKPPGYARMAVDPVRRIAQAIAEVWAGARPAHQLSVVATHEVVGQLERGSGRLGARARAPTPRPVVSSVRVSEPVERVVEACAVVDTGERMRAIALRLELREGRWACTALRVC